MVSTNADSKQVNYVGTFKDLASCYLCLLWIERKKYVGPNLESELKLKLNYQPVYLGNG